MSFLPTFNLLLALSSLGLLAITGALILDYCFYRGRFFSNYIKQIVWPVTIGLTVGSIVVSLFYSEYLGFIPCSLCWLQRIAIYPQALLSILAFRSQDTWHFPIYGLGLSVFGLLVSVYHFIYQLIPQKSSSSDFIPCLVDGSNADCATKVMDVFGFITFPFLSAATFAFLIMMYLYLLKSNESPTK